MSKLKFQLFYVFIVVLFAVGIVGAKSDAAPIVISEPQSGYVVMSNMCHLTVSNTITDSHLHHFSYAPIITKVEPLEPIQTGSASLIQQAYITYEVPIDFWEDYVCTDWNAKTDNFNQFEWLKLTPYYADWDADLWPRFTAKTPVDVYASYNYATMDIPSGNLGYNEQINLAASIVNPNPSTTDFTTTNGFSLQTAKMSAQMVSITVLNSTVQVLDSNTHFQQGLKESTGFKAVVTSGYSPAQMVLAKDSDLELYLEQTNLGFRELPMEKIATVKQGIVTPVANGVDATYGFPLILRPQIDKFGSAIEYNYTSIHYVQSSYPSILRGEPCKIGTFPHSMSPVLLNYYISALQRPVGFNITNYAERTWFSVTMKLLCTQNIGASNSGISPGQFTTMFGEMFWYYTMSGATGGQINLTPQPPGLLSILLDILIWLGVIVAAVVVGYIIIKRKMHGGLKSLITKKK